jgi:Holliday junction resolvase RusA-like endonuclease
MSVKFVIPGRLPGLNDYIATERTNRYKAAKMKREAEADILVAAKKGLRGWKARAPVTMSYTWVEKDRRRDCDNIAFAKKFIQDALVTGGYLRNDNQAWITGFTDDFAVDKGHPRIEVVITERGENDV